MNDKIYIIDKNEYVEITEIIKGFKVIYRTIIGDYERTPDRLFAYQCNDCGVISSPIKNYKKISRDVRLCSNCCRKGERNPFHGKTHSKETIEKAQEKCRIITTEMWKDPLYREKVIKGISKPRREGFKQEQSERISQWYKDNPEQREIRSDIMKRTWVDGRIEPNPHSINKSKGEDTLYQYLTENLPDCRVNNKETIKLDKKWFFPDIIINNKVIVEYFGNYWHGNPLHYSVDDIVNHKVTAGQVWERDKKRIDTLTDMGYTVIVVWSSDEYWVDQRLIKHIKELL